MESVKQHRLFCCAVAGLLLLALAGCAARRAYTRGDREMERQNYDAAVLDFSKAVAGNPGHVTYSTALARAKARSADQHFQKGRGYLTSKNYELAIAEFQQVLLLNPGHQHGRNELQRAIREYERQQTAPSELERLKEQARRLELGPPRLDPRSNIPILLNFREQPVGKIFEALGKASGINFIFDDKTDLEKALTIDIGNVSLEKALDILMLQTKNFYKVIDEYTLLLAPDTRQKRQEYEDQVIRTFFLSSADTKEVVTLLRSLLQARQIAENTELNSVTIKDTPDKVAIAERIITSNDKSKGEVLIDVELLQINRTTARNIGLDLSSKTLSLTFGDGKESVALNNLDALKQSGLWTVGVIPSVVLSFLKSDSDTRFIAQPQLRVSEGEQAEILIGDRVPIPTTSFNTSQTVGGNIVPITSFTYQNVGITVQVEPRVHHNKEVTLKVQVEVSQVTGSIETGGTSQPIIGTRQVQTVIRLRDGETNLLAGLIQRTNSDAVSGVAGLSDIPVLRRLFGSSTMQSQDIDIVMTMTPRIIRIPDITEEDLAPLWVGTEENMHLRGAARSAMDQGPFHQPEGEGGPATNLLGPLPGRRGGTLTIAPSDEVERDREAQGADAERDEPSGAEGGAEEDEGGVVRPPPFDTPPEPEPEDDGPDEEPPPATAGRATVRLIAKPSYKVGEAVSVNVQIENSSNVGSVPFHLKYNAGVLRYQPPPTEGPFMSSDGKGTVFLASDVAGGGEVVVGLSRLGASTGASGTGLLAAFNFMAIAPGDAGFAFTGASVKGPQAGNLPAEFVVQPVMVVP